MFKAHLNLVYASVWFWRVQIQHTYKKKCSTLYIYTKINQFLSLTFCLNWFICSDCQASSLKNRTGTAAYLYKAAKFSRFLGHLWKALWQPRWKHTHWLYRKRTTDALLCELYSVHTYLIIKDHLFCSIPYANRWCAWYSFLQETQP